MSGKKSSAAAPVAAPAQVQTPDVDVAQLAAKKALEARGDASASTSATNADDESDGLKSSTMLASTGQPQRGAAPPPGGQPAARRKPKPAMDPAAGMVSPMGGMGGPAVLTG